MGFISDERLNLVKKFFKSHQRLPSYSEMLQLFSLSSKNSIYKIVKSWADEGLIEKINYKLSPTKLFFSLPLLGQVKAGFPMPAEEDLNLISLDDYLINKPQSSFLLKVSGDSLTGIGILAGDIVIIERQNQPKQEDVVLALIDNNWTLKIFTKTNGRICLKSANGKYPDIYPEGELQIFGIVRSVVRKM